MTGPYAEPHERAHAEFEAFVQTVRPELHRYCTRMIGSVVDAEDLVQEALAKAYAALPTTSVANLRAWLFRIAHNKAIDYLRRARHEHLEYLDEHALLVEAEPPIAGPAQITVALSLFLKLPAKQRSCVILKDVMGYSLADISELLDATVPEIKAALHRGRARLRELSRDIHRATTDTLGEPERQLLARYVEHFNARDFDAVRAMLTEEVQLDLVNRAKRQGRAAVGEYFHRYEAVSDWRLALGAVEGQPAILVETTDGSLQQPVYAIFLAWRDRQITLIRDYRYAPHAIGDVVIAGV